MIEALGKAVQDARDDADLIRDIELAIANANSRREGLKLALQNIVRQVTARAASETEVRRLGRV